MSICTQEFIVQFDDSQNGGVIVLSQISEGEEYPTLFLSKIVSLRTERNYNTIGRDLTDIKYLLKQLNHYQDGQKFKIQTAHSPLTFLNKMIGTNSHLTRWALFLQQYSLEIVHMPGRLHDNADSLSRTQT